MSVTIVQSELTETLKLDICDSSFYQASYEIPRVHFYTAAALLIISLLVFLFGTISELIIGNGLAYQIIGGMILLPSLYYTYELAQAKMLEISTRKNLIFSV